MKESNFLHITFLVSLILKGIDSVLQIIGGIILIFASPTALGNFFKTIFHYELLEDPHDFIANFLINLSTNLSVGTKIFVSIYLLIHGIIKLLLIVGLLKRKIWSYIAAEIVFAIFLVYQFYLYINNHSVFVLILIILDLIVIALTFWEHSRIKHF